MRKVFVLLFFIASVNSGRAQNTTEKVFFNGKFMNEPQTLNHDFESWFMPGGGYSVYQPKNADSLGVFSGVTIEIAIHTKVTQNNNPGPSHIRNYVKLNIASSSKSDVSDVLFYGYGLTLSLEKNPRRTWMIPYFGMEMGGLSHKKYGSTINFSPMGGLHFLATRKLFINAHVAYQYPVKNFDDLQGWYGYAGITFALWQ